MNTIYVDNAATTRLSDTALKAMMPLMQDIYGNPSSLHHIGQAAKEQLEAARRIVADCINAPNPNEIYFTAGGSEADNQAILTAAYNGAKKGKKHIVSSKFEHHAVLHTLDKLAKEGFEIELLDVYSNGIVRVEDVKSAIRPDTALVTIMFANNEVGTIQPIAEIGAVCREAGVIFHTDAVQAVGHIPVDVQAMNIDMLSISAHKFHGPKGVGALYCKKGIPLQNLINGGAQERNKRAGTENTYAIAGFAAAIREAVDNLEKNEKYISALRDKLINGMKDIERCHLNGDINKRLPGTVNFSFEGIEGESLILLLDQKGICSSSGSACTSGSLDPSHVLLSMGVPIENAHGSLRLSLCEYNTEEEIDFILDTLHTVVPYLRSISPVWEKILKGEVIE
ncbi:MAG: cysteine desulfurase NifS [Eubacteriales bacterium]|nr:cysteine desulfurase NifS [Eubacteriales bacterium]